MKLAIIIIMLLLSSLSFEQNLSKNLNIQNIPMGQIETFLPVLLLEWEEIQHYRQNGKKNFKGCV
jgi:hypothetical protein